MNRNRVSVVVAWTALATAPADALTITVVDPAPETRIRGRVGLYVNAQSAFEITSAKVTLDGATLQLVPFASCGTGCVRYFAELTPQPPEGDKELVIELTDASGAAATARAPIIFDRPVTVRLNVKPQTVTGTTMRLQGTCDDNGAPCTSVDLSFIAGSSTVARTLVDVSAFDELFDLTPVADRATLIVATGHDAFPGGEATVSTGIAVNDSPRLLRIAQTSGQIQDADLRRILHVNTYNASPGPVGISIYDCATAMDTQIASQPTAAIGLLTSNGAVWQVANNQIALYRNQAVETLEGSLAHVAGNYVSWGEIFPPYRARMLEVVTGEMTRFSNAIFILPGANGALYYLRQNTSELIRRVGTNEALVTAGAMPVATDGNLVVASVLAACGLDVYDTNGLVDHLDTSPCSAWRTQAWVRDGWVVYFEVHALSIPPYQMFSLHSRAPDGTRALLADNLFGVGFEDVSPAGEVMYSEGGRRFLVSPGHAPVDVATSLGRGMWRDGYWLVAMYDTLFGLDVIPPVPPPPAPPDGTPDGAPDASPDAAPGSDASPSSPDAGSAIDAGTGAASDAAPEIPGAGLRSPGGCGGCSTGGATQPAGLALALLGYLRRRRR